MSIGLKKMYRWLAVSRVKWPAEGVKFSKIKCKTFQVLGGKSARKGWKYKEGCEKGMKKVC